MIPDVVPRSRPVRAVRAGVFAVASAGLGVVAHRLGGGVTPPLWLVAFAATGLFAVAWRFTGSQRRLPMITGLVLATQTLMHVGLSLIAMPGPGMSSRKAGDQQSLLSMVLCRRAGHPVTAHELAAAQATFAALHVAVHSPASTTPMSPAGMLAPSMAWMLAAHLAAAGVMAWWLARGERALWRRARRVVETIHAVVGELIPAVVPRASRPALPAVASLSSRWLVLCVAGRAPPP